MQLRFSSSPRRVEVSAARADFAAWAQALRQERAFLPLDEGKGKGGIRCEIAPGAKVELAWDAAARELHVRGGAEGMDILAEGLEGFSEDGEIEFPWHIEFFDYLAPKSVSVACVLEE